MIAILISLLSGAGLIALGITDVSVMIMKNGESEVSNGFFSLSANSAYHIALYVMGFAFLAIPALYLWEIKNRRR